MIRDIDRHIDIITDALKWAEDFRKDSFPSGQFKDYRRKLKKIRSALSCNCSAAAYGESQVGKSYLMSSLLSSPEHPFVIENQGREYSFIDEINPSGGNNAKIESTGVVTRFTVNKGNMNHPGMVHVRNLSVVDIILMLADSYYNDIKIDPDTVLSTQNINQSLDEISQLWSDRSVKHHVLTEDDVKDINDYVKEIIGNSASMVYLSNFTKTVAPVIQYIPYDKWVDVFSLMWNRNPEINHLFGTLINAYQKINFQQDVFVPFDAVLRSKGTLLKIEWLDYVCGNAPDSTSGDVLATDIYGADGNLIASTFPKGELSALIAELTFVLPENLTADRQFLKKLDLLDFPGARSREKYKEKEIATVLPKMLRRGKVAYLFNKYSRSLQISSVLFCHHNDQKSEPTIGDTINTWIEENIGQSPEERAQVLSNTNGIAPLFFVATKFNIDLERTKTDGSQNLDNLDKHWNRFDTVIPEIIKPNRWFDEWTVGKDGAIMPFKDLYPLRDFYWSGKNLLFDGWSDGQIKSNETSVHLHFDFPDYLDRLKESFIRNPNVRAHLYDADRTWEEVATLNNDGSKAIIRNLDSISAVLDSARWKKYLAQLENLKREIINALQVYYEPEDLESKNKKVRLIAGDIRRSLLDTIAKNPASFGRIIDNLMVSPEDLRNIAYDIIVCHTDTPRDFSAINFYRASAGVDLSVGKEENISRLMNHLLLDSEDSLRRYFKEKGFTLEDIIEKETHTLSTLGDVITKHIYDFWVDRLNNVSQQIIEMLPHADEVVFMLISLYKKLNVNKVLSDKITRYTEIFSENEQPNAIGDFAALTLNNFVGTVGRSYMSDSEIDTLKQKADNCQLPVDFSPEGWNRKRQRQSLEETLQVFDDSADIINRGHIDISTLRKLPFWNNFQRWENFVIIGLIYSSDISHCDPISNEKVRDMIERSKSLYTA